MNGYAFYQAHLALWYHLAFHLTKNEAAARKTVESMILELASCAFFDDLCASAQEVIPAALIRKYVQDNALNVNQAVLDECSYTVPDRQHRESGALSDTDMLLLCMPSESVDMLFLFAEHNYSAACALRMLHMDAQTAALRYQQACALLTELLYDEDDPDAPLNVPVEIRKLRHAVCKAFQSFQGSHPFPADFISQLTGLPPEETPAKKPVADNALQTVFSRLGGRYAEKGVHYLVRCMVFISCCCILIVSVQDTQRWYTSSLREVSSPVGNLVPLFRETISTTPAQGTNTGYRPQITDLRYTLPQLPDAFRRVEHVNFPNATHTYYSSASNSIIFSQQVESEPVQAFQIDGGKELDLAGRKAVLVHENGLNRIDWYCGCFYFSIISDLPEKELETIARDAQIAAGPYETMQRIELEALPRPYLPELAQQNGDLVYYPGKPFDSQRIKQFIQQCEKREDSALRIAYYMAQGVVQMIDLQMQNGQLYCTVDDRFNSKSTQPWERGAAYDTLRLEKMDGRETLVLYGGSDKEPYVLALL